MARVVDSGLVTMDAMQNGLVNHQTIAYIKQSNAQFASSLGDSVSSWFRNHVNTAFERFSGDKVRARLEALMRKNDVFWEADVIRPLTTLADLQHSPKKMHEWLAVHPELNKRINDQTCHGWGGDYARFDGIGADNHLYRVLYHGCTADLSEDDSVAYDEGWVMFFDEEEDNEYLTLTNRLDIYRSHETIDELFSQDRDITDPLNNRW